VFSALWATDKVALAKLFEKSWRYLFSIVFPLSAGIFAIAAQFIMKVYGADYADSIFPLRVLSISLIFGYLAIICASMLNAIGQQRKQTLLMTIALIASVACNLFLLPRYGINGAAFSALFSNLLLWVIGFIFVKKYADVDCKIIFKYALQTLVPAFIMGALVYWLCGKISFLIAAPIGAIAYFAMLFITGGMSKEIVLEVKTKIFGKTSYENPDNNP
jgi:O-antigen/teichoic acid export membrane protein